MKIYVAGKYQEREIISQLMRALERQGHTITCDWTSHVYATPEVHASYCVDDCKGVQDCELYLGIFQHPFRYRGALVELGIALGLSKKIIIVGHAEDDCIFMLHPDIKRINYIAEIPEAIKQAEKPGGK